MASIQNLSVTVRDSPYGYAPTEGIAIAFTALFALSTLCHFGQSLRYRTWWMLPTVCLCGVMEIVGWSARLWSSISVNDITPFTIQISTTIIAPTPLVAANFVILGQVITTLGPAYSRIRPRWYTTIFCSTDVIALTIQAIGGGMASSASSKGKDVTLGANIALAGIVFQMAMITVFLGCAVEFFLRYMKNTPTKYTQEVVPRGSMAGRLLWMSTALIFSTSCLFIRSVYRTAELAGGWNGKINTTQVYFVVFDGTMVILAIYTTNFVHPGVFLNDRRGEKRSAEIP